MKSLVKKNEDRQRHEALKVEAQRAETEAGKQKGNGGGMDQLKCTSLESTFSCIIDAVSCVPAAT